MNQSQDTDTIQPFARNATIQCVLVCLDRSPTSESSLPFAVALARSFGSCIHLVHVMESSGSHETNPHDALSWQIARAEAGEYLAGVAERISSDQVRIETAVLQGHVAEQILCFADREGIDLIVLSSHGEKGVTEWSLASTTEKVLARARASVLVVPVRETALCLGDEAPLERILILLDGSPRAESVLPPLERLARERDVLLVLLQVITPPDLLQLGPPSTEDAEFLLRLESRNERVARRYLGQIRGRLVREGCNARVVVEKGDLRSVLPLVATREEIDLVAITAHGRTGDRRSCFGDTAGHLVRNVERPILMIQNLPQPSLEFAEAVKHRREAVPLRGTSRDQP